MRSPILCLLVSLAAPAADGPANVGYTISTVAGGTFAGDGWQATAAYLGSPEGLAFDGRGNLYISDSQDHRIRKIDPSGIITTVAGNGYRGFRGDGGPASEAQLDTPYGLAADAAGNLYIADLGNARVRRISPDGTIDTVAGGPDSLKLKQPRNVAVDRGGNLYISDFGDHRVYRVTPDGSVERVAGLGWPGSIPDGDAVRADLAPIDAPAGLAFDGDGALYIADSGNGRIRKIQNGMMTTVDSGSVALGLPTGVAFDSAGDLYVADKTSAVIVKLTPPPATAVAGDGTSGNSGDGGPAAVARLTEPRELAFDFAGNLYIADSRPGARYPVGTVRRVSTDGIIETYAGGTDFRPRGDSGPPLWARIEAPGGLALAEDGRLSISDRVDQCVRRVSGGAIATVASGLDQPSGIALGGDGSLRIAEAAGSRVWQLATTGALTRAAGLADSDSAGYSGDGDAAVDARLRGPEAVAIGAGGNLYIADTLNHAIRQVLPNGLIVTIAGGSAAGYSGDGGPASSALLNGPAGIVADAAGNLYVADTGNHAIRKIDALGMIGTVAGTGAAGFGGDGGPATAAQLRSPVGIALDASGNLYIADTGNHRVRRVASDGTITTIAGTGMPGYSGDGGPALSAELNEPAGIVVDAAGGIYVADRANSRVRKLAPAAAGPVEPPAVQLNLVNTASLLPGPVAPGELVSIFGTGLGPGTAAPGRLDGGVLDTNLAGTEVLFDGVPAPLLYAQYSRINLQVPYEMSGRTSANVEIREGGVTKQRLVTALAESAPAIFTADGGSGPAATINEDGTVNSAANPAKPGSIVTIYATGEGQTSPAGTTGKLAAAPYPVPLSQVSLTIDGRDAAIVFAGSAPGYAGLLQINARIPESARSGAAPVEVAIGSGKSQPGVTIAVR
jgi:uncharacterized protein (TIGR03437 family)